MGEELDELESRATSRRRADPSRASYAASRGTLSGQSRQAWRPSLEEAATPVMTIPSKLPMRNCRPLPDGWISGSREVQA